MCALKGAAAGTNKNNGVVPRSMDNMMMKKMPQPPQQNHDANVPPLRKSKADVCGEVGTAKEVGSAPPSLCAAAASELALEDHEAAREEKQKQRAAQGDRMQAMATERAMYSSVQQPATVSRAVAADAQHKVLVLPDPFAA